MPLQSSDTFALLNFDQLPFVDSGASDSAIVNINGVTLDTAAKKFGAGSARFNGTSSFLTLRGRAAVLSFGAADFTIECWVSPDSVSGARIICDILQSSPLRFGISSGSLFLDSGNTNRILSSVLTWTAGVFYHVALVRNGTTFTIYRDGTSVGSWVGGSGALSISANEPMYIGCNHPGNTWFFSGCIDCFRIVTGTALYTSNFTPPSTVLTQLGAVTTYSISYADDSFGEAGANPAIPICAPKFINENFVPNALPYARSAAPTEDLVWYQNKGPGRVYGTLKIAGTPNTPVARLLKIHRDSDGAAVGTTVSEPALGTYEFAGLWMDETYTVVAFDHTRTYRAVVADKLVPELAPITLNGQPLYAANPRFIKAAPGDGAYTAPVYSAQSDPLTDNVILALNFNAPAGSTVFTDSSLVARSIKPVSGSAAHNDTQVKFGTSSVYFNGASLSVTPTISFTADFTIDFWIRSVALSGVLSAFELGNINLGGAILFRTNGDLAVNGVAGNFPLVANQWMHVAIVRAGSTVSGFLDGTKRFDITVGTAVINSALAAFYFGESVHFGGQFGNCFIDDFRVTDGVARYTANFTPPTAQFSYVYNVIGTRPLYQRVTTSGAVRVARSGQERVAPGPSSLFT